MANSRMTNVQNTQFVIRHSTIRHLNSVALRGAEHFINRRHAAEDFQPGVFAKATACRSHVPPCGFPSCWSVRGPIGERPRSSRTAQKCLAGPESELATAPATHRTVNRFAAFYVLVPGEILGQIVALWLEGFFAFRAQRSHQPLGHDLVDMGVEPFLVASTVEAVMAQRLVRTLCLKCREAYEPKQEDLPKDFPWDDFKSAAHRYFARLAVGVVVSLDSRADKAFSSFARQTTRSANWPMIEQAAGKSASRRAAGMRTLREDAWMKVMSGLTTIDEVSRDYERRQTVTVNDEFPNVE